MRRALLKRSRTSSCTAGSLIFSGSRTDGGREDFHSATALKKAMFSPEKSRRAENCWRGSGLRSRTYSSASMVRILSPPLLLTEPSLDQDVRADAATVVEPVATERAPWVTAFLLS